MYGIGTGGRDRGEIVIAAVLPWKSIDAVDEWYERAGLPVDSMEEIDRCLECTYPECEDCIAKERCVARKGGVSKAVGMALMAELMAAGATARELSAALGVSRQTVQRWKRELVTKAK